jgi:hypothetical protein
MIKIYKTKPYHSNPYLGSGEDSILVTLNMPKSTWRLLMKLIVESGYFNLEEEDE